MQTKIEEITKGVYVQTGRYAWERRSLVCGSSWCVLIDAPQHFDEAEELKRFAEEKTERGVRLSVITHGHLDHTATLQLFPEAPLVATRAAREYMLKKGQKELERLSEDDEELKHIRLVLPSVTFTGEEYVFDDSGRELTCIPAPGHSEDSQMILLEEESLLFAGDILSAVVPPYFPDGNSLQLQESIDLITDLEPKILVPGHGPILHGDEIEAEAEAAIEYLENLRSIVREGLRHGRSVQTMQESIRWEDCAAKPAPPEEFLKYHKENVGRATGEVSEELETLAHI